MKRWWITMCCVALAVSAALAQQKKTAPPSPKPTDSDPSLEVTMGFIQDKLFQLGKISLVDAEHNSQTGRDSQTSYAYELGSIPGGSAHCSIDLQRTMTVNGARQEPYKIFTSLKDVEQIVVMTQEERLNRLEVQAGHSEVTHIVSPQIFALEIRKPGDQSFFVFIDEDLANRVAKAIVHAVELCGGGQ
jgi:hypothetical protein